MDARQTLINALKKDKLIAVLNDLTRGISYDACSFGNLRLHSFRRSSDVKADLYFHMNPGKHRVIWRAGLTWKSRYTLTPEER